MCQSLQNLLDVFHEYTTYMKKATKPSYLFCTGLFSPPNAALCGGKNREKRSRSQGTKRKEETEWDHSRLSFGVSLAAITKQMFSRKQNSSTGTPGTSHFCLPAAIGNPSWRA
ncbi:uncharacterized protein RG961_013219 [Leptosomus discolor]